MKMKKINAKKFKFLAHTADVKFQAVGSSLKEVFENSALALFNIIYDRKIKNKIKFKIKVRGADLENLLYNFLEEALVLIDSKNFLPSKIKILKFNEKNFNIEAEILGDDAENYQISMHVKAVTYNEMFIKKNEQKKGNFLTSSSSYPEGHKGKSQTKVEQKKGNFLTSSSSGKSQTKAITYNDMFIKKIKNKFVAQVVLDI